MITGRAIHTSNTAAFLKGLTERIEKGLDAAALETTEITKLLSGTVTTAELRRMNHPFGRLPSARPRGYLPTLPINEQSGTLLASMRVNRVRLADGSWSREIGFTAPYAKYVLNPDGTKRMIPRGFWEAAQALGWRANASMIAAMRGP